MLVYEPNQIPTFSEETDLDLLHSCTMFSLTRIELSFFSV